MSYSAGDILTAASLNRFLSLAVIKTADQTITSSTTLANDTELKLTLPGSITYRVSLFLGVTGATGGDLKTAWTSTGTTTGPTVLRSCYGPAVNTTSAEQGDHVGSAHGLGTSVAYGVDGTSFSAVKEEFLITFDSSGGTVQLQWAQNASSGTGTVVHLGSWLTAQPLVTS